MDNLWITYELYINNLYIPAHYSLFFAYYFSMCIICRLSTSDKADLGLQMIYSHFVDKMWITLLKLDCFSNISYYIR